MQINLNKDLLLIFEASAFNLLLKTKRNPLLFKRLFKKHRVYPNCLVFEFALVLQNVNVLIHKQNKFYKTFVGNQKNIGKNTRTETYLIKQILCSFIKTIEI